MEDSSKNGSNDFQQNYQSDNQRILQDTPAEYSVLIQHHNSYINLVTMLMYK